MMNGPVLVDTGTLVNSPGAELTCNAWISEQLRSLRPPLLACEAASTEAAFLLRRNGREADVELLRY